MPNTTVKRLNQADLQNILNPFIFALESTAFSLEVLTIVSNAQEKIDEYTKNISTLYSTELYRTELRGLIYFKVLTLFSDYCGKANGYAGLPDSPDSVRNLFFATKVKLAEILVDMIIDIILYGSVYGYTSKVKRNRVKPVYTHILCQLDETLARYEGNRDSFTSAKIAEDYVARNEVQLQTGKWKIYQNLKDYN